MNYSKWWQFDKKTVVWADWNEYDRQPCIIMSRCMGYYAPVFQFNIGKKAEFYSRKYFKANTDNQKFTKDFTN